MAQRLQHRGPDDQGVWLDPNGNCALAHRRLSILDLSRRGRQPMVTIDGTTALSFNGEIYNHTDLRRQLAGSGARFRSSCDSETLLRALDAWQGDAVQALDGMFAFAAWRPEERVLWLARDAFGKKPLYWAQGSGWLAFASELDALRAVPGFAAEIDRDAVADVLLLQYVQAPRSIYRNAFKVEPGSILRFDCTGDEPKVEGRRYFRFRPNGDAISRRPEGPANDAGTLEADLTARLCGAVEKRLASDVPLGAFLSGGIDSALVVSILARQLGRAVTTFSMGFADSDESEHLAARRVAKQLGTEHREIVLAPDVFEVLPEIAAALDEPLGDSSCLPTYLLCRFAREEVTVALSGDGGDELFGGYARYRETWLEARDWRRRLRFGVRRRKRWSARDAYLSPRFLMFGPQQIADWMGAEAGAHTRGLLSGFGRKLSNDTRPLLDRMREVDVESYLPGAVLAKVDRMSMAHGLEVRCPLLDLEVAKLAETLGQNEMMNKHQSKPLLRRMVARHVGAGHAALPKRGFGLPGNAWARKGLLEACDAWLLAKDARLPGFVDGGALAGYVELQRRSPTPAVYPLWNLLSLEAWLRSQAEAD